MFSPPTTDAEVWESFIWIEALGLDSFVPFEKALFL
jgi:hypothetical protein